MERIEGAARRGLFAARIQRRPILERPRAPGLREVRCPRAFEDMAATTARSGRCVDVRLRFDRVRGFARGRRWRRIIGASPPADRFDLVDARLCDALTVYSPAFCRKLATTYSRFSFAM